MQRLPTFALLTLLACGPGMAQEQGDPEPWRPLTGRDAGAVGSCHSESDGDGNGACMIVRCNAARTLELVYRHADPPGDPHPTRFNLQIGRYRTPIEFTAASGEELVLSLAGRDALLNAMARPGRSDPMLRLFAMPGQRRSYSTAFELTRAGPMIERVRARCRG